MSSDADRVEALATTARDLATEVAALSVEVAGERARTGRQRRTLQLTIAGLVLDLFLSVFVGIGYLGQKAIIAEQDATRSEVWCPLYEIFVHSYNPTGVAAKEQGLPAYDATFNEIRRQYAALRCVTPAPAGPPKPNSLGPIGDLLAPPPPPPPASGPVAVSLPARQQASPAPRRTVQRLVIRAPAQTSSRKTNSSGGGKSSSLLGSVTKAVPKVKVGADVNLGPVKAQVRLHIP